MTATAQKPVRTVVVEARGIRKAFGHVEALRGVDFEANAGDVTALIGDNGAGKSSLVKVLSGVYAPDSGELLVDGRAVRPSSPQEIRAFGIETVYQDLSLAGDLTPAENGSRDLRRRRAAADPQLGGRPGAAGDPHRADGQRRHVPADAPGQVRGEQPDHGGHPAGRPGRPVPSDQQ
jgi:ABC-type uncharacterized transport system ATPase subunit